MVAAMRLTGVAILLAATFPLPSAQASPITDSLLHDRLIGSWADMGDCRGGALTFNADGTFTLTGPNPSGDLKGTFDVVDGKLAGQAGERVMPIFQVLFDDQTLLLGPDRLDRCKPP
jgi:hypothetical protein